MAERHKNGSFNYKVTNERIKSVLKTRSMLDNTVQVAMPFVKATSTIRLPEFLGDGFGFTLGLHAIQEDVRYEDMFSDTANNGRDPLIGYTYVFDSSGQGKTRRVYASPPENSQIIAATELFDQGDMLFTTSNFIRMPPPGITRAIIGRNKNGLLAMGDITFVVPSLVQLEVLHRTFLIPGVGMILEWGQQFASELLNINEPNLFSLGVSQAKYADFVAGEVGLNASTIQNNMFPWYDKAKFDNMMTRLAHRQVGIQEILECYVYPTQGQYMWMFGRVGNFTTKANSDGSFTCNVKIVGPSEDSWAYSTTTTVLPPITRSRPQCLEELNSITTFFSTTTVGNNLKSLLDKVRSTPNHPWKDHVIYIENGNKKGGEPTVDASKQPVGDQNPNTSIQGFKDTEDVYFFTWRFFVDYVINSREEGLIKMFNTSLGSNVERAKIALLRGLGNTPSKSAIDVDHESFVGMNKFLRSIDPSTMIIANEPAAIEAEADIQRNRPDFKDTLTKDHEVTKKFRMASSVGQPGTFDFTKSAETLDSAIAVENRDRGFLSTGVWLNHKAVVQCMVSGETFLQGISKLLERMNAASNNFWNLTLDPSEPLPPPTCGMNGLQQGKDNSYSYNVIDGNYRENSYEAVKVAITGQSTKQTGEPGLYIFNKYVRRDNTTGKLIGSELTECNIDLSLPKILFAQIAVAGLIRPAQAQALGTSTGDETETSLEKLPVLNEPNDTLRQMFSIISVIPRSGNEKSPDLTILPFGQIPGGKCNEQNSQTTANTAGSGVKADPALNFKEYFDNISFDELKKEKEVADKYFKENDCTKCLGTVPGGNADEMPHWSAAFISYVMAAANINFPFSGNHWDYANKIRNTAGNYGFKVIDPRGGPSADTRPQPGDIILQNNPPANNKFSDNSWGGAGHGDIVTAVTADGHVTSVGGNVSDRVQVSSPNLVGNVLPSQYVAILRPPAGASEIVRIALQELNSWSSIPNELDPRARPFIEKYWKDGAKTPQNLSPWYSTTSPTPSTPEGSPSGSLPKPDNCDKCIRSQQAINQYDKRTAKITNAKDNLMREFAGLEQVFRYVEPLPESMTSKIHKSSNSDNSNAFGAAPSSLSIGGEMVMPGINGLRVGELFWIDRIPAFYRAFGAFQIMSIEDTISPDGWETKINARFNYLGNAWKKSVTELLGNKLKLTNQKYDPYQLGAF